MLASFFKKLKTKPQLNILFHLVGMLGAGTWGRRITSLPLGFLYFKDRAYWARFCFVFCFWWRTIFVSYFGDQFLISRLRRLCPAEISKFALWGVFFFHSELSCLILNGAFLDQQPIFYSFLKKISPGWYSSVDWVPAWEPKGCWFDSQSGHIPGLQTGSPVGGMQEAPTH